MLLPVLDMISPILFWVGIAWLVWRSFTYTEEVDGLGLKRPYKHAGVLLIAIAIALVALRGM